jgi:peptidoglycan hydrolase-like protein with peptidoglycan-binding domain
VHLTRPVTPLIAALAIAASATIAVALPADAATSPSLGSRVLREGATGADVSGLQARLRRTGLEVTRDGRFGAATETAVRTFQSVSGLEVTGVVDRETLRLLRAATVRTGVSVAVDNGGYSRSKASIRRTSLGDRLPVRRGMSGRDVRMLQSFLRRAGARGVTVDGEFGAGTLRAVRVWERGAERRVDGVVDAGDTAELREEVGAVRGDLELAAAEPPEGAAAPLRLAPGDKATVGADGLAVAPASAPAAVKKIIAAGNQIAKKPYVYGGGHRIDWKMDRGYDCSGSVSWALHGAGLVRAPAPSSGYYRWGLAGAGEWVTIYTKASHMYMVVAGLRFDTSGRSRAGTRWQTDLRSPAGFVARHPEGL